VHTAVVPYLWRLANNTSLLFAQAPSRRPVQRTLRTIWSWARSSWPAVSCRMHWRTTMQLLVIINAQKTWY